MRGEREGEGERRGRRSKARGVSGGAAVICMDAPSELRRHDRAMWREQERGFRGTGWGAGVMDLNGQRRYRVCVAMSRRSIFVAFALGQQ